jgi:hypothetical protein
VIRLDLHLACFDSFLNVTSFTDANVSRSGCLGVDVALTRCGHMFGAVFRGGSFSTPKSPDASVAVRGGWITKVATTTGNNSKDSASIDGFLTGFATSVGMSANIPVGPTALNIGPSVAIVKSGTSFDFKSSVEVGGNLSLSPTAGASGSAAESFGVRITGGSGKLW